MARFTVRLHKGGGQGSWGCGATEREAARNALCEYRSAWGEPGDKVVKVEILTDDKVTGNVTIATIREIAGGLEIVRAEDYEIDVGVTGVVIHTADAHLVYGIRKGKRILPGAIPEEDFDGLSREKVIDLCARAQQIKAVKS